MTERLDDTWYSRELPTLTAAARIIENEPAPHTARFQAISDETGLDHDQTGRALRALEAEGLIEVRWTMPQQGARVVRISGEARRVVGLWPSPETGLDRMIAALETIAADEHEPEPKRSRARTILGALGGAGRDLGVDVMGAVIASQLT